MLSTPWTGTAFYPLFGTNSLVWPAGPPGATVSLTAQPTRLQFANHTLESQTGVQQGDPLGPLLFSTALQPLASELRTCGLDIAVHYLDDGVLAGDLTVVSDALRLVQRRATAIGLHLNLSKRVLVTVGPVNIAGLHMHFPDALLRAPDGSSKVSRHFELLGGAIGDDNFVLQHTVERAAKAGDLLDAIGELPDPQVGLRLLRSCAGFAKLVHSMRCNPPDAQQAALRMFDGMVRRSFGDLTGLHPTGMQWQQASLGLGHAGLGLRSTAKHASAAYLASLGEASTAAQDLDTAFSAEDLRSSHDVRAALAALNANLHPQDQISFEAASHSKQHDLSLKLDLAGWQEQLGQATIVGQATLQSEGCLGARAFLAAILYRLAGGAWNLPLLLQNYALVWAFRMQTTPVAMGSWTCKTTTQGCALQVVRGPNGTTPCGI